MDLNTVKGSGAKVRITTPIFTTVSTNSTKRMALEYSNGLLATDMKVATLMMKDTATER